MRKPDVDFDALEDLLVRAFGPPRSFVCERTPNGTSTQVYRLRRNGDTYYVRIAEDAASSLVPEAEVHRRLVEAGARVPEVVYLENFDEALRRSVLITTEVPGTCTEGNVGHPALPRIFRAAGRDLALVHAVEVAGFGWIDRRHGRAATRLSGMDSAYAGFVELEKICTVLADFGFAPNHVAQIEELLAETIDRGPAGAHGQLAHGDFDPSHIYRDGDGYSGLIDFGEIRGTDYAFDFATMQLTAWHGGDTPAQPSERATIAYQELERGYAELRPLPADHQRRVYLAGVHQAAQRLAHWFERDGARAREGWFPRWIEAGLIALLDTGRPLLPVVEH